MGKKPIFIVLFSLISLLLPLYQGEDGGVQYLLELTASKIKESRPRPVRPSSSSSSDVIKQAVRRSILFSRAFVYT